MTLKQLASSYTDMKYKDSTVPQYGRPSHHFSDKSANDLTKAILAFFEIKHIKAWRQASEGRFLPGTTTTNVIGQRITQKGKFIPRAGGAVGSADITCTIPPLGRRLEIEVKYGKDRQSDAQKKFQQEIEEMGAIYIIVKTWEDFQDQIMKIL